MSRVAYVDGQYLPHRSTSVYVEASGYQFGDGIYDVLAADGPLVGPGTSGPLTCRLREFYLVHMAVAA